MESGEGHAQLRIYNGEGPGNKIKVTEIRSSQHRKTTEALNEPGGLRYTGVLGEAKGQLPLTAWHFGLG